MSLSATVVFPADHPTAGGHFPGNPIVPGAMLLDEVLHALGVSAPCEIRSAKFLHIVRPGDTLCIDWERQDGGDIRFDCKILPGEQPVLTGSVRPC